MGGTSLLCSGQSSYSFGPSSRRSCADYGAPACPLRGTSSRIDTHVPSVWFDSLQPSHHTGRRLSTVSLPNFSWLRLGCGTGRNSLLPHSSEKIGGAELASFCRSLLLFGSNFAVLHHGTRWARSSGVWRDARALCLSHFRCARLHTEAHANSQLTDVRSARKLVVKRWADLESW